MLRVTRDCRNSAAHGLITFRLTKPPLWGEDLWCGPPNTLDEVRHLGVELIPQKTTKRRRPPNPSSRSASSLPIRPVRWLPRRRDTDRGRAPQQRAVIGDLLVVRTLRVAVNCLRRRHAHRYVNTH